MIKNYFKIALRILWKSKGYAAINVVGLSVAFCVCVFWFLTAYRQLTFDGQNRWASVRKDFGLLLNG